MPETPTTEAAKRLEERLAYDKDPAHYEPGDYFVEYRPLILAIEAEAAAAERERLRGEVPDAALHIERAWKAVIRMCNGDKRWVMTVPAEPERDSDLVIGAALDDLKRLVALLADPAEPEPSE